MPAAAGCPDNSSLAYAAPADRRCSLGCAASFANYPPLTIAGCTNPAASNYNFSATVDDGSCVLVAPVPGCINPGALNYNPLATVDDGSCVYPAGGGGLRAFDFAVIRYRWEEQNGTDLDTRTTVTAPFTGRDLGWMRGDADPDGTFPGGGTLSGCQVSAIPEDTSALYLAHGGDNCEQGVEAVLVNMPKIMADYPQATVVDIRLRAFWFSVRADGNITLEFQTYLGGFMSHLGYDFVNTDGVAVQTLSVVRQVPADPDHSDGGFHADVDGFECGILRYDPATKSAVILPP